MRYVQTSEAQVEQKREHCTLLLSLYNPQTNTYVDVRVVKAFESALELLNGS
jgi:hypothetical protein